MTVIDVMKNGVSTLAAEDITNSYDRVANSVPKDQLHEGLAHAFRSDETPEFAQMLSNLFSQSNPDQKAGLLNQLAKGLGGEDIGELANKAGLGSIANALSAGNVTPQQALQITPQAVQTLAEGAEKNHPSIVDLAAGFYAQHPTLVKSLGAGALALLMAKIASKK